MFVRALSNVVACCALTAALVSPCVAHAAALGFLARSTFGYFDESDVAILRQTASQVLDSNAPNARQKWTNPSSGNSGNVAVLGSFTGTDGAQCKRLHIVNHVKRGNLQDQGTYIVCKYSDRGWVLHSGAQPGTTG